MIFLILVIVDNAIENNTILARWLSLRHFYFVFFVNQQPSVSWLWWLYSILQKNPNAISFFLNI